MRLGPRLDGFGAISGGGATSRLLFSYSDPVASEILDLLFLPSYGASLHHLKVEIGGDGQSSEGVEPSHLHVDDASQANYKRGYEWRLLVEARKRNPAILLSALAWTWPGWVGAGTRSPWTDTNKSVSYILSWLEGARDVYGIRLNYINADWNERGFSVEFVLALRARLDAAGFADLGIVCGDDAHAFSCAAEAAKNSTLKGAIVALGSHGPLPPSPPSSGLPLWNTEVHVTDPGGTDLAPIFANYYVQQNITAGTLWNALSAYNPGLFSPDWGIFRAWWPWCDYYEPVGKLWAFAHYTQATRPGMHWLEVGSGAGELTGGGVYASFVDPASGALTLIVSKPQGSASEAANFTILGSSAALNVLHAVRSRVVPSSRASPDLSSYFVLQPDVPIEPASRSIALVLSPGDLWTLTSAAGVLHKGAPTRAVASPTPFPRQYRNDFSACPLFSEAPYFTDMTGVFECREWGGGGGGGRGVVMQQVAASHPIAWRPEEQRPFTLFASNISAGARVNATVAFSLNSPGDSALLGVNANPNCCGRVITGEDLMPGAWLSVAGNGSWALYNAIANVTSARGVLAEGGPVARPPTPGTWHTLRLVLEAGGALTASLDGVVLFFQLPLEGRVPNLGTGFVGFGTGDWGEFTSFADFEVVAE